ncbi:creatininase family protein [Candidatus Bathyarchaeota archaeon]|nr:creatininase family protein [Candidatus Bathyarchaeota archaeon]
MVQLAEISWPEAQRVFDKVDTALIPVGSTEQHGPHNPLGTDHLLAEALAKRVGDATGVPVTPIIPVGVSEHHRQFPGSLWAPVNVFKDYMMAVAMSMASHGVTKILFINGHGGNTSALLEVCGELRRDYDVFACVAASYPPGLDGHAGEGETSQNLYFHPSLVDMTKAVDTTQREKLGPLELIGINRIGPAVFPWDTVDLTDTGVLGAAGSTIRSTTASAEKGREMMEPYIEEVAGFVEKLKKAELSGLLCKPHKSLG